MVFPADTAAATCLSYSGRGGKKNHDYMKVYEVLWFPLKKPTRSPQKSFLNGSLNNVDYLCGLTSQNESVVFVSLCSMCNVIRTSLEKEHFTSHSGHSTSKWRVIISEMAEMIRQLSKLLPMKVLVYELMVQWQIGAHLNPTLDHAHRNLCSPLIPLWKANCLFFWTWEHSSGRWKHRTMR